MNFLHHLNQFLPPWGYTPSLRTPVLVLPPKSFSSPFPLPPNLSASASSSQVFLWSIPAAPSFPTICSRLSWVQVCSCVALPQKWSVVPHPCWTFPWHSRSLLSSPGPEPLAPAATPTSSLGSRHTQHTATASGKWHFLLPLPRMPFPFACPMSFYLPPRHST